MDERLGTGTTQQIRLSWPQYAMLTSRITADSFNIAWGGEGTVPKRSGITSVTFLVNTLTKQ